MRTTTVAYPLVLTAAVAATHAAHLSLDATEVPESDMVYEALPSVEALRLMSLGYPSLVADYYWLRAISHFGDNAMHAALYPNLEPLLRRVLALDPYFAAAYFFAGTALTLQGMDSRQAIALLQQGMRARPDVWQIPYLLGFNAYYFHGDYKTAAHALARAAKIPGAPPVAGPLATRLAAEAGEPEVGLQLIDSLLEQTQDPKVIALYEQRRAALTLELHLKWLNAAVRRYGETFGQGPDSLEQLVQTRLLRHIPSDPLGGRFYLDANGRVQTTSESSRLRLDPKGGGTNP
jgi:tetratricopeptide (TPR) repeat protein